MAYSSIADDSWRAPPRTIHQEYLVGTRLYKMPLDHRPLLRRTHSWMMKFCISVQVSSNTVLPLAPTPEAEYLGVVSLDAVERSTGRTLP